MVSSVCVCVCVCVCGGGGGGASFKHDMQNNAFPLLLFSVLFANVDLVRV